MSFCLFFSPWRAEDGGLPFLKYQSALTSCGGCLWHFCLTGDRPDQEFSTTWWGRVTEEPLMKEPCLSLPFKKKVRSSPFPLT